MSQALASSPKVFFAIANHLIIIYIAKAKIAIKRLLPIFSASESLPEGAE